MLRCVLLGLLLSSMSNGSDQCDEVLYIDLHGGTLSSPGYPNGTYPPGIHYSWCLQSPENTVLSLVSKEFNIPKSDNCEKNRLLITCKNEEAKAFCGSASVEVNCSSNEVTLNLDTSLKSRGGSFYFEVRSYTTNFENSRAVVYSDSSGCDCGLTFRERIVGGTETGINEFPFMCGILQNPSPIIRCGCTIISPRFVITAAHCLETLDVTNTAVVVGEHNVTTNSETPATRVIRVRRFLLYPYYDSDARLYDIAMMELATSIVFSARVGPVCLPFDSRNTNLVGATVTICGWGTTEFGGPRSRVLMKVNVDIVNIAQCKNAYPNYMIDDYTQLCAYRPNADACQYDSGGFLLYYNYNTYRNEIVGLVSYGRGCAAGVPSVNTKVAPFLQWIVDNTREETLCYKTRS